MKDAGLICCGVKDTVLRKADKPKQKPFKSLILKRVAAPHQVGCAASASRPALECVATCSQSVVTEMLCVRRFWSMLRETKKDSDDDERLTMIS